MPEMPACRPDEFYADQHVIGHIGCYPFGRLANILVASVILCWFSDQRVRVRLVCTYILPMYSEHKDIHTR